MRHNAPQEGILGIADSLKNIFRSKEAIDAEREEKDASQQEWLDDILPLLEDLQEPWSERRGEHLGAGSHPIELVFSHHDFARIVWRRCFVLSDLYEEGAYPNGAPPIDSVLTLMGFAKEQFFKLAPESLAGQQKLTFSDIQKKKERQLIERSINDPRLCYIYLGKSEDGRTYIGQTTQSPEERYLQHRKARTGPYKTGQELIEWSVIKTCSSVEADYWESFFIGAYRSHLAGFNDTTGQSRKGFVDGERTGVN